MLNESLNHVPASPLYRDIMSFWLMFSVSIWKPLNYIVLWSEVIIIKYILEGGLWVCHWGESKNIMT